MYHSNIEVIFGDHLKYHWLILKLNWNLGGQEIVFSGPSADIADVNSGNIIFTIKDTKLYVLVITLLTKGNQKIS